MTDKEHALHQFDDYQGLDNGKSFEQRKAKLEAREKELMVHVPMVLNTTLYRSGSKLHGARNEFIDQQ